MNMFLEIYASIGITILWLLFVIFFVVAARTDSLRKKHEQERHDRFNRMAEDFAARKEPDPYEALKALLDLDHIVQTVYGEEVEDGVKFNRYEPSFLKAYSFVNFYAECDAKLKELRKEVDPVYDGKKGEDLE